MRIDDPWLPDCNPSSFLFAIWRTLQGKVSSLRYFQWWDFPLRNSGKTTDGTGITEEKWQLLSEYAASYSATHSTLRPFSKQRKCTTSSDEYFERSVGSSLDFFGRTNLSTNNQRIIPARNRGCSSCFLQWQQNQYWPWGMPRSEDGQY